MKYLKQNLEKARLLMVEQAVIIERVLYWADEVDRYAKIGNDYMVDFSNRKIDGYIEVLDGINEELGVLWN